MITGLDRQLLLIDDPAGIAISISIAVYLSLITPVFVALHYIWSASKWYASNKRLQIDAATPRDWGETLCGLRNG